MHDDRDSAAFSQPDIDAIVDAYCEADAVRQVALHLGQRPLPESEKEWRRRQRARDILNQWADAREARVAKMLEE